MSDDQPTLDADEVRQRAARVAGSAASLRALPAARVVAAIADAAAVLADPTTARARAVRPLLSASSGLSPEMVDWALRTTCGPATRDALSRLRDRALHAGAEDTVARPARLCVVVASSNVFTASFRAIALPLLAGTPVVTKASSRDDAFARVFAETIADVSPDVAASLDVLTFEGGTTELEDALFAQADVVAAYGSDATLADIRGRLPATTAFVPHGHGLGAAWAPAAAVAGDDAVHATAARIALDVAAYDQRGCLSPHAIWVEGEPGPRSRALELARALATELERLRVELPRGALPTAHGGHQVQWRGVAAARGDLFEGDGYAVSYEGHGPFRLSPGYRNVSVLDCSGADDLGRRLTPLGMHLKALGVAADRDARRVLATALPPPLAPRISAVGEMQTPPLASLADAADPFAGIVRLVQVD